MPVVEAMLIVISQHPPIITAENRMIDIGKIVAGHIASMINPYFPPQQAVATFSGNPVPLIVDFIFSHDLSYHACSLFQYEKWFASGSKPARGVIAANSGIWLIGRCGLSD
jgi:hypothetical protein